MARRISFTITSRRAYLSRAFFTSMHTGLFAPLTLRARLVALFVVLAAMPILALGVWTYAQSMRALESLLGRQTAELAARAAVAISDRVALRESDLLLIAENLETQRFFASKAGSGSFGREQRAGAERYLDAVWRRIADDYASVDLLSAEGASILRLGAVSEVRLVPRERMWTARRAILDAEDGRQVGFVSAAIRVDRLLPLEALEARFGEAGATLVIDRGTGQLLYHADPRWLGRPFAEVLAGDDGADRSELVPPLEQDASPVRLEAANGIRIASIVALAEPPWTVMATASRDEFAAPFAATRKLTLAVVLAVTLTITIAFVLMLHRATRSLSRLTTAADAVGRGDFAPSLPAAGADEVGRLTRAFAAMVAKIRAMIVEVEQSRQMAVLGEFAAHVSHEIRNPLTSMKMNLQSLERDAAEGRIPDDSRGPIAITLRELRRLEGVARGVLDLARQPAYERTSLALHDVVQSRIDLIRPQAARQKVEIAMRLEAGRDEVNGAAEPLGGAVLNLLLNALDAMSDGGTLEVTSRNTEIGSGGVPLADPGGGAPVNSAPTAGVAIVVRDTGPGVPEHLRTEIFRPFHTGKPGGTGLGLPLARRIATEHGGRLYLLEPSDGAEHGAAFVLEMPLANR